MLRYMLDESEFLSPYGIRALSRFHRDHPYVLDVNGTEHRVDYEPGESTHRPVRRKFQLARADLVSGEFSADRVAAEVSSLPGRRFQGGVPHRLGQDDDSVGGGRRIVAPADAASSCATTNGRRPGVTAIRRSSRPIPHWRDLILFYEYFHGDNGAGSAPATRPAGPDWSPS